MALSLHVEEEEMEAQVLESIRAFTVAAYWTRKEFFSKHSNIESWKTEKMFIKALIWYQLTWLTVESDEESDESEEESSVEELSSVAESSVAESSLEVSLLLLWNKSK